MLVLVCSECGSTNWGRGRNEKDEIAMEKQRGIDNWPMGVCYNHAKPKIVPVISSKAFEKRKRTPKAAKPIEMGL